MWAQRAHTLAAIILHVDGLCWEHGANGATVCDSESETPTHGGISDNLQYNKHGRRESGCCNMRDRDNITGHRMYGKM